MAGFGERGPLFEVGKDRHELFDTLFDRKPGEYLANWELALQKPIRGLIVNTETGEEREFPMNPTELQIGPIPVNFNRREIHGMSHQPLIYKDTGNVKIPVTFIHSRIIKGQELGNDWYALDDVNEFVRFMASLTVRSGGEEGLIGGAPPKLVFIWPRLVGMICHLVSLQFRFIKFDIFGSPTILVAQCEFEEARDSFKSSEEYRRMGFFAGWDIVEREYQP